MGVVSLDDILVTPLKRIPTVGGDVMHGLKKSDNGFNGFGEVYFSWVEQRAIKAWKCHQRITLNLLVPLGEVRFVFFSKERLAEQKEEFRIENWRQPLLTFNSASRNLVWLSGAFFRLQLIDECYRPGA